METVYLFDTCAVGSAVFTRDMPTYPLYTVQNVYDELAKHVHRMIPVVEEQILLIEYHL